MASVEVGEKLGGRYFVVRPIKVVQAGAYFEVRDPQGDVATGQFLRDFPVESPAVDGIRAEVVGTPNRPRFLLPDAVLQSTSGLPTAVFLQPVPEPLATHLATMAGTDPVAICKWLLESFARVAEDLAVAHGAQSVHGAVNTAALRVTGEGDDARMLLASFGLEPASRAGTSRARPLPREDLGGVVLALQEAFQKTRSEPDATAITRWVILRNCARGGVHPAFESGTALAQHLRGLLPVPPAVRRASAPAPVVSDAPPPARPSATPGGFIASPDVPPEFPTRRVATWAAGLLVIGAAAVGVNALRNAVARGHGFGRTVTHRDHVGAACGAESVDAPAGMDLAAASEQFDALCSADRLSVVMVSRAATSVFAGARQNTRGGTLSWGPVFVADGVRELGTTLTGTDGAYVAWRTDGPTPFGVAELARTPRVLPVSLPGWMGSAFRGAFLLRAAGASAAIATTLTTPTGPAAVVIRLDGGSDASAPASVYRVADGEVLAAEAGDPATLLVATHNAQGSVVGSVAVPLTSLPMLAMLAAAGSGATDGGLTPDGGSAPTADPRLLPIPAVSLQRSATLEIPGDALTAVPYGVHGRFVVTAAAPGADGVVSVLTFPPAGSGTPSTFTLAHAGHGMDLAARTATAAVAVVAQADGAALYLLEPGADPARARFALTDADRVRAVACANDVWLGYARSRPQPRAMAVPLPCVSAR